VLHGLSKSNQGMLPLLSRVNRNPSGDSLSGQLAPARTVDKNRALQ
jgi:hypothetical protein